jgi:hypothetical protein
MTNLMFTLWMLLFPVAAAACAYVYEGHLRRQYSQGARTLSVAFDVATWLAVGYLLYGS